MFGLLGAAAVIMFRRGINPLTTGIGTAIVLNLFITFTIPGDLDRRPHRRLVAGAAAGSLMAAPRHARQPNWVTYAAPIAVAVSRCGGLRGGDQPPRPTLLHPLFMIGGMSTSRTTDQLSLFPAASDVPERFRLDDATRRRGLRHVARIRAQLEARYPSKPAARSPVQAPGAAAALSRAG